MDKSAKRMASDISTWISKSGVHRPILLCEIVGYDQLQELVPQLRNRLDWDNYESAMLEAQAVGMRASAYARRIADALDQGRISEAKELVQMQKWPAVSIVTHKASVVRLLDRILSLGSVELEVALLHPTSRVVCVSFIVQHWKPDEVTRPYDEFCRELCFEIEQLDDGST